MEQYVNNSECLKLDSDEVDYYSLGAEYSDVDVKRILRNATRESETIFEVFSVQEKGEHQVASKMRWDDCQRRRKPQEEKAWKESQELEEEDKRKWFAANEDTAKKMLKYLQDSEDLKVGFRELKVNWNLRNKQAFLSCRLPNRQGMREAKSSSRSSGEKRMRCRCQSERERARMLQRLGGSRAIRHGSGAQDTLSFESCSSSMACDMEEVSLESSKTLKEMY